jgi:hypothetical protein
MRPPARIKDVQKLTGSLAALSRFISRLAERVLPFFKLLRKSGPFSWTEEAEQAFQELKQHLVSLPILVAPEPREPLYFIHRGGCGSGEHGAGRRKDSTRRPGT